VSNVPAGTRLPAHATPMGQLLLSRLSRAELAALYRGHALAALTDQTPTTLDALYAAVQRAAAQGYVVSHGSMEAGGNLALGAGRRCQRRAGGRDRHLLSRERVRQSGARHALQERAACAPRARSPSASRHAEAPLTNVRAGGSYFT